MLKLIFVAIFFILINGCTSQKFYEGAISIVNPCREDLSILVENYTPWIGPVGGGDSIKLLLPKGEKKIIAVFRMSTRKQNIAYLFSRNGKGFRVVFSDGRNRKILTGDRLYSLVNDVSSSEDISKNLMMTEINNVAVCP